MAIILVVGLLVAAVGVVLALRNRRPGIEGGASAPAVGPAPGAGPKPPVIHFDLYRGEALVRSEQLAREVIKIGTHPNSHLRLDGDGVNRTHAVIEAPGSDAPGSDAPGSDAPGSDALRLIDLGSREGTLLNGERIHSARLRHGDRIEVGSLRLVVGVGAPPPRTG